MPTQRPGKSSGVFTTPKPFIEAVKRRLWIDAFTHDLAADATNTQAVSYYDEAQDALSKTAHQWACWSKGGWAWLNPPFKRIRPWAERCAEMKREQGNVALLVPASVGSDWFAEYVDGQALVLMLQGRLAFMPDKPTWGYPKDCILCLYSEDVAPGYAVWDWRRR